MAERGFPTALKNALSDEDVCLAILGYLDLQGGALYAWSGIGDLVYNANTYIGGGKLFSFDKFAESIDKADIGLTITMNYLDDDLRNEIVTNDSVGRDASLTLALIAPATMAVTAAYQFFTGFVDECEIIDNGQNGSLNVRLASELAKLQRPKNFRYSNAHQQFLFPGDLGMEFATKMDETILWGRKPVVVRTNPGYQDGYYTDPQNSALYGGPG